MNPLRLLRFISIVLAAAVIYLAYGAYERVMNPVARREIAFVPEAGETPVEAKAQVNYAHYKVIEQANIFKCRDIRPTPPPPPTPVPPTPRPLPPLQLELKGTTTSPLDGHVKAIIYNKRTRSADYYSKNDVIPETDGTKIIEISRDKVVLDRGGQTETLEIYPGGMGN